MSIKFDDLHNTYVAIQLSEKPNPSTVIHLIKQLSLYAQQTKNELGIEKLKCISPVVVLGYPEWMEGLMMTLNPDNRSIISC